VLKKSVTKDDTHLNNRHRVLLLLLSPVPILRRLFALLLRRLHLLPQLLVLDVDLTHAIVVLGTRHTRNVQRLLKINALTFYGIVATASLARSQPQIKRLGFLHAGSGRLEKEGIAVIL